jgi:bacillithiol biosynthesis cysteine-adding enzyme BshC
MRDLAAEYLAESPDLMGFFARPASALFGTAPKTAPWDPAFVEALTEYNTQIGGRPLFLGDEAVVITGQQPGLFTGPLYTIYKAMTAILLAKKVHDRSGVRCVPVFWVAGDDHDFEEVRTAHVLSKSHEVLSLTYAPEGNVAGLPVHRVPLEASLHGLIDRLASSTTGSEFRTEIAQFLHESLEASDSMADWTARILARLFCGTPLVLFSPHLPVARTLAAPVLEREIGDPLVSTMLLNDAGQRLRDLDFHRQVVKGGTECNFFIDADGRRSKVLFEDERYAVSEESASYSAEGLLQILHASPERFTANVALRCIVQQHLFPVAAYVAGPGELAYWAQLKPLFRHFGKEMPVVYPRARCLLTNSKCRQITDEFGFAPDAVTGPVEGLIERALNASSRAPAQEAVRRNRDAIVQSIQSLAGELDALNANAAAMTRKLKERVAGDLDRIERAIAKADEDHADSVRKQVLRVCATLFPLRKPQERVLNIFSFRFEHGWGLIPRLMKEINVESFDVKEIEL